MNLKRTQNKLLKNGFLPDVQDDKFEKWIDPTGVGTAISFHIRDEMVSGGLRVHGRRPDRPQFDEFNSAFTRNVKQAILLSRV
jgi:hypothetical protein